MNDCAFCDSRALADRLIVENELARAFPTNAPIVAWHVLIAPKRHAQYFEELTVAEKDAIEELRMKLHQAFKNAGKADGFNYAWNEEKIGGQSVPHFHIHMLPRTEGDAGVYQYEPREFIYRPVPIEERPISPQEELQEVVKEIRTHM